jgi:aquaporin Z
MSLKKRVAAEFIGTFWLVLGGCGAAVLSARIFPTGIGILGVALAFGLSLLTGAYAFGAVSGAHFNPTVTVGLAVAKRFPQRDVIPYIAAQVLGAIVGAFVLLVIASGSGAFDVRAGFAANGYGIHSPGAYTLGAALLTELVLSFMFVMVVLGVTDERSPQLKSFAPLAIGLALTAVHLVGIPVTNMSVNPARSTGQALFVGGWAVAQLWLFWMAPLIGGVVAGVVHPAIAGRERERPADQPSGPIAIAPEPPEPAPAH